MRSGASAGATRGGIPMASKAGHKRKTHNGRRLEKRQGGAECE